ncbi:MAG: thioredoxin domain-containing protein [Gemmatimonadetes bacterium]|nr:thioredoxin domain-containing protein [Gemmatimonadota bacterium]MDA1102095.1 thioredoxin domain-containing protein [Gemmatimonadota bacterium]
MNPRFSTFAAMSCLLVAVACTADAPAPGTSDLTRSLLAQPAGDGMSTPLAAIPSVGEAVPDVPVEEIGFNRGRIEAPVKVIEMSDYGCGYCRQFHQETFPTLLTQFIDAGLVEWKFVPYITGMFDNSLAATEAAECTYVQSAAAFERLNARLWDDQSVWKGADAPAPVVRAWAAELGIDMMAFDACLESDSQINRIASSTALAREIGVRGTPTFIVIGYPPLQGALPLAVFQDVLTRVYAATTGEPGL